jgi:hypothetical protein
LDLIDPDIRQDSRMQNRQGLDIWHYNPKGEGCIEQRTISKPSGS